MSEVPEKHPGWIELRACKAAVLSQMRCRRECSLSMLALLFTLAEAGDAELSSQALVRRMRAAGNANVRQLLHDAFNRVPAWVGCREDKDGRWWLLTEAGWGVVARAVRRGQDAYE